MEAMLYVTFSNPHYMGVDGFVIDGLEDWTFAADGRMRKRQMSGNETTIKESERWFREDWTEEQVDAVHITEEHW